MGEFLAGLAVAGFAVFLYTKVKASKERKETREGSGGGGGGGRTEPGEIHRR